MNINNKLPLNIIIFIFVLFIAYIIGSVISKELFSLYQILILTCGVIFVTTLFNKPAILALFVVILMFIPLSFGHIFKIGLIWLVEPLILILFVSNILRLTAYKHKDYALSRKNPFLISMFLYFIIIFLNYIRNPVPSATLLGLPPEMGGLRYYYENFLLMLLFFSFSALAASVHNFVEKVINTLFWIVTITTIVGVFILFFEPIELLNTNLQQSEILHVRAMTTGWWSRSIHFSTNVLRSGILYSVAPLGILLLASGNIKMKKMYKIILFSMFTLGLIFSGTRSFFYGTIIALIVLAFQRRKKKLFFLIIIGGVLVYCSFNLPVISSQFQRLFLLSGEFDQILSGRGTLYSVYWKTFLRHPIFGVGFGTTTIDMVTPGTPEYFLLKNLRFGGHSIFLGILYTRGLIGFIPFLWIYSVGILTALRLSHIKSISSQGLFCLLFLIYSIIPFMFGGGETYNLFFPIMGILSGLYLKYNKLCLNKN